MIAAPHLVNVRPGLPALNGSTLATATLDAPVQIGPAVVPVSQLLGPVLVGVLLNCFVYGVAFLQWIQYCLGRNRDRPLLKALVHWCFFIDSVHTAGTLWMIWRYAVDNFANTPYLATTLWPVSAAPMFVGDVSTPIQHLFAWRIKHFTHAWWIFVLLSLLSVAAFALGLVASIGGLVNHSIETSPIFVPFVDAWLSASMACDVVLACLLYTHLLKSRTGFRSTDTVIGRLMRSSIETTAASAIFAILYLITFSVLPRTNFHTIFSLALGRVYTGTLLSTLNSRSTLREELYGNNTLTCDGEAFQCSERMRRIPAEVAINVEQHVESAQAEAVDFRELRRSRRSAAVAPGDVKTGLDEDDAEVDADIDEARSYVSDAK